MEDLVELVGISFDVLHLTKITNNFLQKVIEFVILCDDNNNYKIPHISTDKLERSGQFPICFRVLNSVKAKL